MSECYVCTKPTGTKLGAIPYCPACLPRDPRRTAPTPAARVPAPRPTPPYLRPSDGCVVMPGGFCNGTCVKHACSSDFCTC